LALFADLDSMIVAKHCSTGGIGDPTVVEAARTPVQRAHAPGCCLGPGRAAGLLGPSLPGSSAAPSRLLCREAAAWSTTGNGRGFESSLTAGFGVAFLLRTVSRPGWLEVARRARDSCRPIVVPIAIHGLASSAPGPGKYPSSSRDGLLPLSRVDRDARRIASHFCARFNRGGGSISAPLLE
jgi:hypothetical protein